MRSEPLRESRGISGESCNGHFKLLPPAPLVHDARHAGEHGSKTSRHRRAVLAIPEKTMNIVKAVLSHITRLLSSQRMSISRVGQPSGLWIFQLEDDAIESITENCPLLTELDRPLPKPHERSEDKEDSGLSYRCLSFIASCFSNHVFHHPQMSPTPLFDSSLIIFFATRT